MTDISWQQYVVEPGKKVKLSEWDPDNTPAWKGNKESGEKQIAKINDELEALQEQLYAEGKHKVLIVLQGMDTSGKDGVIRRAFDGVNPLGVRVASFKVPTAPELARDYLWRIHQQVPGRGEIVIFNRSHYEDVLVVRVHNMVSKQQWGRRYAHINHFEQMLVDEGTTILKFYLHIDMDEQRERLLARLDEPDKRWKFNPGDLEERKLWGKYEKAYEDVLSKTSQKKAPWIIVPANRKWYRDLVILAALVDTLKGLKMEFPQPAENLDSYRGELEG
ncbi:MAG TPA: polyphosphate kinase 2 family protein [Anaerolineales bacterium]|nr:polyphosphate kinase 2 family protein [Anaerolineales bacterium]